MGACSLDDLCYSLGLAFSDGSLLEAAFTHSSYRNEHRHESRQDNERLEFLGDAVLELCVSQYLYRQYPHVLEGELTRMRSSLVCESSLVDHAKSLQFPLYLRLGKGEEQSGGRERASLLADVFEAFIGALFLDQGLLVVERFLAGYFYPHIPSCNDAWKKDYKTILQEWVQRVGMGDLVYETVVERGPAHDREFVVRVLIAGSVSGEGCGRSKKEAEQQAAAIALRLQAGR